MSRILVDLWQWRIDEDATSTTDMPVLSRDELRRAERYKFDVDRIAFVKARAGLRNILSQYVGAKPSELEFVYAPHGKPSLANGPYFNLSHSGAFAALGVCRDAEIGVDIEQVTPIETDVSERFFSANENKQLGSYSGDDWLAGFYRCWVSKEAIVKADGRGLSIDLRSFDVDVDLSQPGRVLAFGGSETEAKNWSMHLFAPTDGYAGAIALYAPGATLIVVNRSSH